MKVLAFIGLMSLVVIVSAICGTILALLEDDTSKRERWSRTLDEEDYFKVDPPEFLKKEESVTDTNVGNKEFKEHIMDRFTKVR